MRGCFDLSFFIVNFTENLRIKYMEEIWREARYINPDGSIDIFNGYEVSNLGRVKTLNYHRSNKEKIMKPCTYNKHGHQHIVLRKNSKMYCRFVHRLILSTFNTEGYFDNAVVDHIDSKPSNNRLDNLRWITYEENNSTEHAKQAKSKAKIGFNNPHAQSCEYDGIIFGSIREAYRYVKEHGYMKTYETFKSMIKKQSL